MRTLKENEVAAEFLSIWDDGYTSVYSPCIINIKTKEVVNIYKRGREVYSKDEDINNSNVDDCVDSLDGEYIYKDGNKIPVFQKKDWVDENTYWHK